MKILHIIDSEGFYGAEVMLIHLASQQKKNGLHPIILNLRSCPPSEQSIERQSQKNQIKFFVIDLTKGLNVFKVFKILQLAQKKKCTLIHSHGYKSNILIGLIPKIVRKVPIVTTIHGWTATNKFSKMWLFECLDTLSLCFIDEIVVVNRAMLTNKNFSLFRRLKPTAVNNGIPLLDFGINNNMFDNKIVSFCRSYFTIGSIGRLSKEKGFDNLIQAFATLIQKGIQANLIIIGEGPERDSLEKLIIKHGLDDRVVMPGYKNAAMKYIPFFDAFVISSLTEGLPITLLEAMQAKIPVIATSVGGIPEVLEHGKAGILIKPGDILNLTESIFQIYKKSKNLEKKIETAYHMVFSEYSIQGMADRYSKVYQQVIRRPYGF